MTPESVMERRNLLDRPVLLASLLGVVYLPFTLLGYGNDIDVPNVLRSGRSWLDGDYQISRRPGSTPVELGSAVLDDIGGSVLVNLVSLAFAVLALACLGRILQRSGVARPGIAMLVLAVHPWFWVAATSLGDFAWALGLLLAGVDAAQRDRRWLAGVLFGLATGARATSLLLVLVWLAAERLGDRSARPPVRATVVTGAMALAVAALCFVPPWIDQSGVDLLEAGLPVSSVGVQLGRWAIKNLAVVGVLGVIVLLAAAPRLLDAVRTWRTSVVVRFALLGFLLAQLSFLRLPLKPVHLLPAVACVALLAGVAFAKDQRWLWLLVASQVVHGVVALRIAEPDQVDEATGGRFEPALVTGVLVNDVECRLDDIDRGEWPDPDDPDERSAADERGLDNFTCQQRPWRPADAPLELSP